MPNPGFDPAWLDWNECVTRVALILAVDYGERGACERPTDDDFLQLCMVAHAVAGVRSVARD